MYRVKRNNVIKFWFITLIILIILGTILPLKPTAVTVAEEYTELEEITKQIPENVTEEVEQEVTLTNSSSEYVNVDYEIILDGELYRTTDDDLDYANQDYLLTVDERITYCTEFEYEFKKDSRLVNTDDQELCLNNTRIKDFTLTELYVGSLNDHYFKVEFTKKPKKLVAGSGEYTEIRLENMTVTKYTNVTEFVDVTKTRNVEKIEWQWFWAFR